MRPIKAWIERQWDKEERRFWWVLSCPTHCHLDKMPLSHGTFTDAVKVARDYAAEREAKAIAPLELRLPGGDS